MRKKSYLSLLILSVSMAACISRVENIKPQYETKSQIPMNVNSITVVQKFNPYSKTPESDQLFSKTLVQNVEKWAKHRILPISPYGIAQITVKEASIIELPNSQNLQELEGRLDVVVTLIDKNGTTLSSAEASIRRNKPALQNLTEEEHKAFTQVLIAQLVDALDKEMEDILFKKLNTAKNLRNPVN